MSLPRFAPALTQGISPATPYVKQTVKLQASDIEDKALCLALVRRRVQGALCLAPLPHPGDITPPTRTYFSNTTRRY